MSPEEVPAGIKSEPIYFLPDALFQRTSVNLTPPELVKDIPIYDFTYFLDQLGKLDPLMKRYGEIANVEPLNLDEFVIGQESLVFRVQCGDKDLAVKIFFGAGLTDKQTQLLLGMIPKVDSYPGRIQNLTARLSEAEELVSSKVYCQIAGFIIGNSVEAKYVDKPVCIFAKNGVPIGFVTDFVAGDSVQISKAGELIRDKKFALFLSQLKEKGVQTDDYYHSRNARVQIGKGIIKLFDLFYPID